MAMVAALVLTMLPLGMLAGTTEVSAATRTITVINGTADGKAADHISKLAKGDFKCSWKVADGKKVKAVYYVDNAGELKPVKWTQDGDTVHYEMDSLGLYNNVIRYADPATEYHFVGSSSDVWKKGSESALEFRVKAEDYDENIFEKFAGIEVDDRTVGAENYETAKGSIIIRLKPS